MSHPFSFNSSSQATLNSSMSCNKTRKNELSRNTQFGNVVPVITKQDYNTNKQQDTSIYTFFKKFNLIKNKAIRAIKEGKIFIIVGEFPVVRRELQKRGWIEKNITQNSPESMPNHQTLLEFAEEGNEFERQILSNLVADYPADFVFGMGCEKSLRYVHDFALSNTIRIGQLRNFTRKDSLCDCVSDSHFYTIDGLSEVNVPRSVIIRNGAMCDFKKEYRFTMCCCLLHYIRLYGSSTTNAVDISDKLSKVAKFVQENVKIQFEHIDIEENFIHTEFTETEWNEFAKLYVDVVKHATPYCLDSDTMIYVIEVACLAKNHWPETSREIDNIWILKPYTLCGGNGVRVLDTLENIENGVMLRNGHCILQKYIERPLLIYNTKFDIRYFFLLSINNGYLQLWDYTNCYLRFSSEEFCLDNLQEKIHLTNHTIQMRHKNGIRSDKLPNHNMWNLLQFQEYLESINEGDKWKRKIYPAIKSNLIGIVMLSLEDIDFKPNRFQIYGADFLITDDFLDVYLLEVNARPAIHANPTVVTAVIFKKVVEDTIKVVLDRQNDTKADTGDFKLLFQIEIPKHRNVTYGLFVSGEKFVTKTRPKKDEGAKRVNEKLTKSKSRLSNVSSSIRSVRQ